ncbi:MAG TPA: MerC domain-containing protein [Fontimonas sp.]
MTFRLPGAGDRTAILLSGLCLVHCLALPLLIALLPWLAWLVDNESVVHRWLLVIIVPVSALALIRGCARHGRRSLLWLGAAALALLAAGALLEFETASSESALTLAGSVALSLTHLFNLRALRHADVDGGLRA